jgi:cytochrome c
MEEVLPPPDITPIAGVFRNLIGLAGTVLTIGVLLAPSGASATLHGRASGNGAQAFKACAGCHSLKPGDTRVGPSLAGLFGRMAGSVSGFRYSKALRRSGILWNATTLNEWLANPQRYVPNNRMPFGGIRNAGKRANLITYLQKATRKKP